MLRSVKERAIGRYKKIVGERVYGPAIIVVQVALVSFTIDPGGYVSGFRNGSNTV